VCLRQIGQLHCRFVPQGWRKHFYLSWQAPDTPMADIESLERLDKLRLTFNQKMNGCPVFDLATGTFITRHGWFAPPTVYSSRGAGFIMEQFDK
jgi:hypothetical protein